LKELIRDEYDNFGSRRFADVLKKLQHKGLIHHMLGRTYSEGEGEYCTFYYYRIYTTDGWVLSLDFDYTT